MFERTRQTRRSAQRSVRQTIKVQRGGALFYRIPADRLAKWTPILDHYKLTLTANTFVGTKEEKTEQRMKEYYRILEVQDKLFEGAIKIIASECGIPEDYEETDVIADIATIDGRKAALMPYIDDIEQLVNFNKFDIRGTSWKEYTKLQDIRTRTKTDGTIDENLSDLLLYPARLTNVFIDALAAILIVLKKDSTVVANATTPRLQQLLAQQYETNVRINALNQTQKPLRDGFYLAQKKGQIMTELYGIMTFDDDSTVAPYFVQLITELQAVLASNEDDIFKHAGALVDLHSADATWAYITAQIFLAYRHDKLKDILSIFDTPNLAHDDSNPDRTHTPNPPYDDIAQKGTTYKTIRSWMDDMVLQFILHLSYTIRKKEDSVIAEMKVLADAAEAAN